jgi:competence protein CoiA
MLSAKRKSDGEIVSAYFDYKQNAPFVCLQCNEEVMLKAGRNRINHFAHVNPIACKFSEGESDQHRKCKIEIFEALRRAPGVTNVALERPIAGVRPDISADRGPSVVWS